MRGRADSILAACPRRSFRRDWRSRKARRTPRPTATSTTAPPAARRRPRHVFLRGNSLPGALGRARALRHPRDRLRLRPQLPRHLAGLAARPGSAARACTTSRSRSIRSPCRTSGRFTTGIREFDREAAELHARWPMLVPGGHRAELDDGNVVLTLFFADIKVARDLRLAADAFYLDGFAPAKNPDMWSPQLMRALSRLAAPGATAATWSVAAAVRHCAGGDRIRRREARRVRPQEGNARRAQLRRKRATGPPRETKGSRGRRGRRRRRGMRAPVRARLGGRALRAARRAGAGGLGQPRRRVPSDRHARTTACSRG